MGQMWDIRSGALRQGVRFDEMDSARRTSTPERADRTQQIEQVGAELRAMMPWNEEAMKRRDLPRPPSLYHGGSHPDAGVLLIL